jgi:hypothetical protein
VINKEFQCLCLSFYDLRVHATIQPMQIPSPRVAWSPFQSATSSIDQSQMPDSDAEKVN